MRKAKIIIGLGFGDEGKGITTDYLASQSPNSIVIRFSGGQQAAHTVKIGTKKHVHSSFASGSLRGLPSYISEHCSIYPIFLYNERIKLIEKGGNTEIHVHPLTKITTPFDIWKNRSDSKNLADGSCGKGVGATMKRQEGQYKLFAIDLLAPKKMLIEKLKAINYFYGFAKDLKLEKEVRDFIEIIDQIELNIDDYDYLMKYDTLIFEGSQGILLDMNHGIFPNVTYANTTSKNAIEICTKLNIDNIELFYVTRSYLTRHGTGWMSNNDKLQLLNNEDETCEYNEYQKEFRIGNLDYDLLNFALKLDAVYVTPNKKNLVVTCLDQIEDNFYPEKFKFKFDTIYGSFSADSKDFIIIN